jgi:hypothetical protein
LKKDYVKVFDAYPKPSKLFANAINLQFFANLTSAARAPWVITVTASHFLISYLLLSLAETFLN